MVETRIDENFKEQDESEVRQRLSHGKNSSPGAKRFIFPSNSDQSDEEDAESDEESQLDGIGT